MPMSIKKALLVIAAAAPATVSARIRMLRTLTTDAEQQQPGSPNKRARKQPKAPKLVPQVYFVRHEVRPLGNASLMRELYPSGKARARGELAQLFREQNVGTVISSPFRRVMQTVAPFAEQEGLKLELDLALMECMHDGVFTKPSWGAPNAFPGITPWEASLNPGGFNYLEQYDAYGGNSEFANVISEHDNLGNNYNAEKSIKRSEMIQIGKDGFLAPESDAQMFQRLVKLLKRVARDSVIGRAKTLDELCTPRNRACSQKNVLLATHKDVVLHLLPMWRKISAALFDFADNLPTGDPFSLKEDGYVTLKPAVAAMSAVQVAAHVDAVFLDLFGDDNDLGAMSAADKATPKETDPATGKEARMEMGTLVTLDHGNAGALRYLNDGAPSEDGNTPVAPAMRFTPSQPEYNYVAPRVNVEGEIVDERGARAVNSKGKLATPMIIDPKFNYLAMCQADPAKAKLE